MNKKQTLLNAKIRPFISEKVYDAVGSSDLTLIRFILEQINNHVSPDHLVEEMTMFLDGEDAEVFVVVVWRLLILETEAKGKGLQ